MIKSKNGCFAFTTTHVFRPFDNTEHASIGISYGNRSSAGSMEAKITLNLIFADNAFYLKKRYN